MDAVVLACVLVIFAATFGTAAYVPLAPFLARRSAVGLLLTAQGLASCIALVPSGKAVDSLGSERVLKAGMVVFASSLVLSSASVALAVQLLGRICSGAGGSMLFCAGMAMIMERFQEPLRAEHVGTSIGVGTLGNLAGPPAAGYLYALALEAGIDAPLALALAPAGVLLALAYAVLLRVPTVPFRPKEPLLQEQRGQDGGLCLRIFGVYAAIGVRSWVISFALACLFGAETALLCAGALDMQARGFSAREIGLIAAPAGLLQAVCARCGGRMAATPRRRISIMVLSPLTLAVSLLCCFALSRLLPEAGVVLPITVAVGVASAMMSLADAPSISLMSELAVLHGRGYGEAMTASELAVCAGQAAGPSLGVLVLQQGSFGCLCLVLAACGALVSAACAAFLRHVEPPGGEAGEACRA